MRDSKLDGIFNGIANLISDRIALFSKLDRAEKAK